MCEAVIKRQQYTWYIVTIVAVSNGAIEYFQVLALFRYYAVANIFVKSRQLLN